VNNGAAVWLVWYGGTLLSIKLTLIMNMELHEQIKKVLAEKGIRDTEEYNLRVPKTDMLTELTARGFAKEEIDEELERLCLNGTLAMDEINVYDYDEPI
jgi:hypothetical protein